MGVARHNVAQVSAGQEPMLGWGHEIVVVDVFQCRQINPNPLCIDLCKVFFKDKLCIFREYILR
jgi:hypothetical protein